METLFENKTKCSQKEYNDFLKSYKKEYEKSDTAWILFNFIFFGICMIIAFLEKEFLLGIALILGLSVYFWFKIIKPTKEVEKDKKSHKTSGHFVNNYEFYKNFLRVENVDGKAQILYFKLYRVVETNTDFYIYISRQYAFIVSKLGFTKGTSEEFAQFMKKKMFARYKNRIS